jgi:DNA-binding transcriptional LysR family regulator
LHRTTRRVSLSDAGAGSPAAIAARCSNWPPTCRPLAGARSTEPTGKLRITTSLSFAQAPAWHAAMVEFQVQYPRIEIELLTIERR